MKKESDSAVEWLFGALRRRVRGERGAVPPPATAPEHVERLAGRNRLEPLMSVLVDPAGAAPAWARLCGEWDAAYRRNLVRGLRSLQTGTALAAALEQHGIPCIATRGPFAGSILWGDAGERYFADLDLLVPLHLRDRALDAAGEGGFRLRGRFTPRWFYRRHHLHWPLERRSDGVLCDIHWAADHPYTLLRADYAGVFDRSQGVNVEGFAWREPCPEHQVLLTAVHLGKEARHLDLDASEVAERGLVVGWMDMALTLARHAARLDWDEVWRLAEQWFAGRPVAGAVLSAANLLGAPAPEAELDRARAAAAEWREPRAVRRSLRSGWFRRMGEMGGFREERLLDAAEFVWPPARYFAPARGAWLAARRVARAVVATLRLARAVADGLLCQWIVWFRRKMVRWTPPEAPVEMDEVRDEKPPP